MLELDGWNAPFGRPRKEPVIKETIKSRIQTTRYPGASLQTRHAFGTNFESTELKGRWMTKATGQTAVQIADNWIQFVQDERTCRIAWGTIVSYTGYIEELELARESEHEIAWKMKLQIDTRDDLRNRSPIKPSRQPIEDIAALQTWVNFSEKQRKDLEENIEPDFFDQLDGIMAELNKPSAELAKLVGRVDDIHKATFSALQHFRGAITGIRTSLLQLREIVVNTGVDVAMLIRTAESDIAWVKYQYNIENQVNITLDQLAIQDRQAELRQKTIATKFVTAKEGDTWESISTRATGSPGKAGEIRSLNGARYGEKPTPGEDYLVNG